jgi:hypothetical protein
MNVSKFASKGKLMKTLNAMASSIIVALSLSACSPEATETNATSNTTPTAVTTPNSDVKSYLDPENIANIHARVYEQRAFEAAVWSMSLMNYKTARDAAFGAGMTYNDVGYYATMQDWKFQVATPNDTTPYWFAYWNVKDGPVVIEIPESSDEIQLFGTLMDAWQRPLDDIGPGGADKGKGGKYLMVHEDYEGELPEGYLVYRQKTFDGYTIIRPIIKSNSQEDVDKASALVTDVKLYSLGQKPQTQYIDLYGKDFETITKFDDTLFDSLNNILQNENLEEKDKVMMGILRGIGIKMGEEFNPTTEQRVVLSKAAKDAHAYMLDMYHNVLIPPYYENKTWTNLVNQSVPETGFTFAYPDYVDVDNRGALYYAIISSAKNLGAATYYLSGAKDNNGLYLDGGKNYTMHVEANVPVRNFWSVQVYDLETAAWLRGQDKVGVANTDIGVQVNEDGSTDLYFGPTAPTGNESNWTPTTPGKEFFLLFRFYGPEEAVFDKSWQLNDIMLAE